MGDSAKLAGYPTAERCRGRPITVSKSNRGKMEAYRIDRFGSVDGIVLRSSEDPRPGPKEVLMRVRASSLNYRDLMVLKGGGRGPTKLGVVPLSDGAGEVAALGDGVTRVKIGDRIAGCFHPRWFGGPIKPDYLTDRLGANLDGMLAEYAVAFLTHCRLRRCGLALAMQWLAAATYPKPPGLTSIKSRLSARFQKRRVYGRALAS
jgi:NADPH:quinone reductase-like Zn-dependent oxidoreductase